MANDCLVVTHDFPIATHECPIVTRECPVVSHECPLVSHECPVVSHECPIVAHECPVMSHECPVVSDECPVVNHECPMLTHECPAVSHGCLFWTRFGPGSRGRLSGTWPQSWTLEPMMESLEGFWTLGSGLLLCQGCRLNNSQLPLPWEVQLAGLAAKPKRTRRFGPRCSKRGCSPARATNLSRAEPTPHTRGVAVGGAALTLGFRVCLSDNARRQPPLHEVVGVVAHAALVIQKPTHPCPPIFLRIRV